MAIKTKKIPKVEMSTRKDDKSSLGGSFVLVLQRILAPIEKLEK
jgi:hypothetical protein